MKDTPKITHVENKIYKNLVLTHRMHKNQAEIYQKNVSLIKFLIILTTISVFVVLIMPLEYNISWWIKFGIALLDLFLILYESGFRPEERCQTHQSIAKQLLPLRNNFAIAMSDYVMGRIDQKHFIDLRNKISNDADRIYSRNPEVSRRAVLKAKKETKKYLDKHADYSVLDHSEKK